MSDTFAAAKALADHLESEWQNSFSKYSCGMRIKDAPDPVQHFEVRVRDGAILVLCRTAEANGWHRIRKLHGKNWRHDVKVSVVFETRDTVAPTLDEDEDDHVIGGEG